MKLASSGTSLKRALPHVATGEAAAAFRELAAATASWELAAAASRELPASAASRELPVSAASRELPVSAASRELATAAPRELPAEVPAETTSASRELRLCLPVVPEWWALDRSRQWPARAWPPAFCSASTASYSASWAATSLRHGGTA